MCKKWEGGGGGQADRHTGRGVPLSPYRRKKILSVFRRFFQLSICAGQAKVVITLAELRICSHQTHFHYSRRFVCAQRNLFTLCRPFFRLISTPSDLDVGHTASVCLYCLYSVYCFSMTVLSIKSVLLQYVLSIESVLLQYVCTVYTVCSASVCLYCLYSVFCFSMSVLSIQCVLLQYVCTVYTVCTASVCLYCLYSVYCFSMSVLSIQCVLLQYVCTVYTVCSASVCLYWLYSVYCFSMSVLSIQCLYFLYSVYCFSMSVLSIQCVLLQQNRVSAAVVFIRSFRFTSNFTVLVF